MPGLRQTVLAIVATAAIACLPIRPAAAAGPLLFAPWALGHIVLPLIFASAAASSQPQATYPTGPAYNGGAPGYYPPPYYARPPVYYAQAPGYPQAYYRPRPSYAPPMPRLYAPPRGYYPSRPPYYGAYGRQGSYRSGAPAIAAGKSHRREPIRKGRHGGRPSRAAALQLRDRILQAAAELFLTEGYGSTSIEAVAARAGVSKRTFYYRFDDKAALFAAVVHRIIEQIRPPPEVPLLKGAKLDAILRRLAGIALRAALAPQAIALHRLVIAESGRFPNLVRAVYDDPGTQEAVALIGDLLARELRDARLTVELRRFAAAQFLHMVVALPQRRSMGLGSPMTARELETWGHDTVSLFLNGCQGLSGGLSHQKRS